MSRLQISQVITHAEAVAAEVKEKLPGQDAL